MEWCFKCGVSSDTVLLFDAVSGKGIVKICEKCSLEEDFPVIKKPSYKIIQSPKALLPKNLQAKMSNGSKRMYERLSKLSRVQLKEDKTEKDKELLERQNRSLKEIANKNYEEGLKKHPGDNSDLIDNFHWIVMRARRFKKLTQEQLSKELGEPESAVKMIEQGIAPNNPIFVKKIEDFLGIKISKKILGPESESINYLGKEIELKFDPLSSKNLTISDLQEMKKRRGDKTIKNFEEETKNIKDEETPKKEKDDSFDEDIDDIIFRGGF